MTTAPKALDIFSSDRIALTNSPTAIGRRAIERLPRVVCRNLTTSGRSLEVVLISGNRPLLTMATSRRSPFFCHWPATTGVVQTFFTGLPVHFTGPTIMLDVGLGDCVEDRLAAPSVDRRFQHIPA